MKSKGFLVLLMLLPQMSFAGWFSNSRQDLAKAIQKQNILKVAELLKDSKLVENIKKDPKKVIESTRFKDNLFTLAARIGNLSIVEALQLHSILIGIN